MSLSGEQKFLILQSLLSTDVARGKLISRRDLSHENAQESASGAAQCLEPSSRVDSSAHKNPGQKQFSSIITPRFLLPKSWNIPPKFPITRRPRRH
jgi:hypothetical protein